MSSDPTSSSSAAWGIALLRVSLGVMWIAHALLELFVFALPGTAQFFTSLGLPGFLPHPVLLVGAPVALWLLGDGAGALRRSNFLAPRGAAA